jgi:hypothetical protein
MLLTESLAGDVKKHRRTRGTKKIVSIQKKKRGAAKAELLDLKRKIRKLVRGINLGLRHNARAEPLLKHVKAELEGLISG